MDAQNSNKGIPVVKEGKYSKVVNGVTTVQFNNLKGFIKRERNCSLSGLCRIWATDNGTMTRFLKGDGSYPSCLYLINRLERHFGIRIEGDSYR